MKQERTAAALVLALVRARVRRLLGATNYNEAMRLTIDLDGLLNELAAAEHGEG